MTRYFTIEVYNRRKWSDRYSCQYLSKQDAEDRARELYREYELNEFYKEDEVIPHISNYYRIKETVEETIIHELQ
jgi:hypothetical protein